MYVAVAWYPRKLVVFSGLGVEVNMALLGGVANVPQLTTGDIIIVF